MAGKEGRSGRKPKLHAVQQLPTFGKGPDAAVQFINRLVHTKGPDARKLFNLRPWQKDGIIRPLFRINPLTGRRQYRTCLLMLPRKNGKSELAAAIALYCLTQDGEIGGEVYSAAGDRDQASLIYHVAAEMVRQDPELDAECDITEGQKRIVHKPSGSMYKAISSEAYTKHGFNASVIIADELHTWPGRELWDVLTTSQGARAQPLTLAISTAGYDRHSILFELYSHAKQVRATPELDPTFLPLIYEAPADADWSDELVWHGCNPALGDFRSIEEMRIMAARARAIPAQENTFRRLYLNQWTEQSSRWISMAAWDECQTEIDWDAHARGRCFIGMDLASTRDLTALVAVFPDDDGGFDVLPCFFVPEETSRQRSIADKVPYDEWARRGWLVETPGNVVDYERVRAKILEWDKRFSVQEIAYDPWNATDLVTRLTEQDGLSCVPMRQGFASLSAPTKSLEKAIVGSHLRHDGHPVMRWNMGNVSVETDPAGNLKPSKKVSTDRIDGCVALIMAIDRMERNNSTKPPAYQLLILGMGT